MIKGSLRIDRPDIVDSDYCYIDLKFGINKMYQTHYNVFRICVKTNQNILGFSFYHKLNTSNFTAQIIDVSRDTQDFQIYELHINNFKTFNANMRIAEDINLPDWPFYSFILSIQSEVNKEYEVEIKYIELFNDEEEKWLKNKLPLLEKRI